MRISVKERGGQEYKRKSGDGMEISYDGMIPGGVIISVDHYENDEMSGRLYHLYADECEKFHSVLDMVKTLERLFDRIQSPKRAMEERYFHSETEPQRVNEERPDVPVMKRPIVRKGMKATFAVYVCYRRNASWQGQVMWEEEKKKVNFRSVLELLKLMDNAMGD